MAGMTQKQLPKHYLELDKGRQDGYEFLYFDENGIPDLGNIIKLAEEADKTRYHQALRELSYWGNNVADATQAEASKRLNAEKYGAHQVDWYVFQPRAEIVKSDEAAGISWAPGVRKTNDVAQAEADKKILEQDATDKFLLAAQRADIVRPSFGTGQMFAQPEPMLAPGMGAYKPKRNGILKARGIL